jgi:hypothetical protein
MALKVDANAWETDHKPIVDAALVISFFIMVPFAFIATVMGKSIAVSQAMQNAESSAERVGNDCDRSLVRSFRRLQLGLTDLIDHRLLAAYVDLLLTGAATDPHKRAGRLLWANKTVVAHLDGRQIVDALYELSIKLRLTRSEEFAFHFTSMDSARMILESQGIRSSLEGQLGGGVSVCVSSIESFKWEPFRPVEFREAIGRALWGQKWQQVMPGAQYADKLDVVLIVRVPTFKDQEQFVPDRPDVYIIPEVSLERDPQSGRLFLSNTRIAACFVLQPPGRDGTNEDWIEDCPEDPSCLWDLSIAGDQYTMSKHTRSTVIGDVIGPDNKLNRTLARVAQPMVINEAWRKQHQVEGKADNDKELWEEDVTRFTKAEMTSAMASVLKGQLCYYSLAYYFTSKKDAEYMIWQLGGIRASTGPDGGSFVTVTMQKPEQLGWDSGGHSFRQQAGKLFFEDWSDNDPRTQVMVVLRVPTFASGNSFFRLNKDEVGRSLIPNELLVDAKAVDVKASKTAQTPSTGPVRVYPNAHILKWYAVAAPPPDTRKLLRRSMQAQQLLKLTRSPPALPLRSFARTEGDMDGSGGALPNEEGLAVPRRPARLHSTDGEDERPQSAVQQASLSAGSLGLELRQPSDELSSGVPKRPPPPLPVHSMQPTSQTFRERVAIAVNWAEEKTGWDIDRDGDIGVLGSANIQMTKTPVLRSLSDPGEGHRVKPPSLAPLARMSQRTPPALATLAPMSESTTAGTPASIPRGVTPPRPPRLAQADDNAPRDDFIPTRPARFQSQTGTVEVSTSSGHARP